METLRRWLERVARRVRPVSAGSVPAAAPAPSRLGLALSGGFARGIAHVGVLRVLEEERVPVHCVAGTSVGAVIAAAYACGSPSAEMERQARITRFRDFGRWTLSWLGLASNERLEEYLCRFCTAGMRFDQLTLPLAIAATDLATGEPVYFTEGEVGPALRASCAFPGMFLPVELDGRTLVDGFLTAPVPVDGARALGADRVIAVHLRSGPVGGKPRSAAEVLGRSFSILERYAHHDWRPKADLVIEPDVTPFGWDEFDRAAELIAAGEEAARAAVPQIRALFGSRAEESPMPRNRPTAGPVRAPWARFPVPAVGDDPQAGRDPVLHLTPDGRDAAP